MRNSRFIPYFWLTKKTSGKFAWFFVLFCCLWLPNPSTWTKGLSAQCVCFKSNISVFNLNSLQFRMYLFYFKLISFIFLPKKSANNNIAYQWITCMAYELWELSIKINYTQRFHIYLTFELTATCYTYTIDDLCIWTVENENNL